MVLTFQISVCTGYDPVLPKGGGARDRTAAPSGQSCDFQGFSGSQAPSIPPKPCTFLVLPKLTGRRARPSNGRLSGVQLPSSHTAPQRWGPAAGGRPFQFPSLTSTQEPTVLPPCARVLMAKNSQLPLLQPCPWAEPGVSWPALPAPSPAGERYGGSCLQLGRQARTFYVSPLPTQRC